MARNKERTGGGRADTVFRAFVAAFVALALALAPSVASAEIVSGAAGARGVAAGTTGGGYAYGWWFGDSYTGAKGSDLYLLVNGWQGWGGDVQNAAAQQANALTESSRAWVSMLETGGGNVWQWYRGGVDSNGYWVPSSELESKTHFGDVFDAPKGRNLVEPCVNAFSKAWSDAQSKGYNPGDLYYQIVAYGHFVGNVVNPPGQSGKVPYYGRSQANELNATFHDPATQDALKAAVGQWNVISDKDKRLEVSRIAANVDATTTNGYSQTPVSCVVMSSAGSQNNVDASAFTQVASSAWSRDRDQSDYTINGGASMVIRDGETGEVHDTVRLVCNSGSCESITQADAAWHLYADNGDDSTQRLVASGTDHLSGLAWSDTKVSTSLGEVNAKATASVDVGRRDGPWTLLNGQATRYHYDVTVTGKGSDGATIDTVSDNDTVNGGGNEIESFWVQPNTFDYSLSTQAVQNGANGIDTSATSAAAGISDSAKDMSGVVGTDTPVRDVMVVTVPDRATNGSQHGIMPEYTSGKLWRKATVTLHWTDGQDHSSDGLKTTSAAKSVDIDVIKGGGTSVNGTTVYAIPYGQDVLTASDPFTPSDLGMSTWLVGKYWFEVTDTGIDANGNHEAMFGNHDTNAMYPLPVASFDEDGSSVVGENWTHDADLNVTTSASSSDTSGDVPGQGNSTLRVDPDNLAVDTITVSCKPGTACDGRQKVAVNATLHYSPTSDRNDAKATASTSQTLTLPMDGSSTQWKVAATALGFTDGFHPGTYWVTLDWGGANGTAGSVVSNDYVVTGDHNVGSPTDAERLKGTYELGLRTQLDSVTAGAAMNGIVHSSRTDVIRDDMTLTCTGVGADNCTARNDSIHGTTTLHYKGPDGVEVTQAKGFVTHVDTSASNAGDTSIPTFDPYTFFGQPGVDSRAAGSVSWRAGDYWFTTDIPNTGVNTQVYKAIENFNSDASDKAEGFTSRSTVTMRTLSSVTDAKLDGDPENLGGGTGSKTDTVYARCETGCVAMDVSTDVTLAYHYTKLDGTKADQRTATKTVTLSIDPTKEVFAVASFLPTDFDKPMSEGWYAGDYAYSIHADRQGSMYDLVDSATNVNATPDEANEAFTLLYSVGIDTESSVIGGAGGTSDDTDNKDAKGHRSITAGQANAVNDRVEMTCYNGCYGEAAKEPNNVNVTLNRSTTESANGSVNDSRHATKTFTTPVSGDVVNRDNWSPSFSPSDLGMSNEGRDTMGNDGMNGWLAGTYWYDVTVPYQGHAATSVHPGRWTAGSDNDGKTYHYDGDEQWTARYDVHIDTSVNGTATKTTSDDPQGVRIEAGSDTPITDTISLTCEDGCLGSKGALPSAAPSSEKVDVISVLSGPNGSYASKVTQVPVDGTGTVTFAPSDFTDSTGKAWTQWVEEGDYSIDTRIVWQGYLAGYYSHNASDDPDEWFSVNGPNVDKTWSVQNAGGAWDTPIDPTWTNRTGADGSVVRDGDPLASVINTTVPDHMRLSDTSFSLTDDYTDAAYVWKPADVSGVRVYALTLGGADGTVTDIVPPYTSPASGNTEGNKLASSYVPGLAAAYASRTTAADGIVTYGDAWHTLASRLGVADDTLGDYLKDVTDWFDVTTDGTKVTATMDAAHAAGLADKANATQFTMVVPGTASYDAVAVRKDAGVSDGEAVSDFCTVPTKDGKGKALVNSASASLGGVTFRSNRPGVCGDVPPAGKKVLSAMDENGDLTDVDGRSVTPGQSLDYDLDFGVDATRDAYTVDTFGIDDVYDELFTPDMTTIRVRDKATGMTIPATAYTQSQDTGSHTISIRFGKDWIESNVAGRKVGYVLSFRGRVSDDLTHADTVDNHYNLVVRNSSTPSNTVSNKAECPDGTCVAKGVVRTGTGVSIDGRTLYDGEGFDYTLTLDAANRKDFAYDVWRFGVTDDYDESHVALDVKNVKVLSDDGTDVTDRFWVADKGGVLYVYARTVDTPDRVDAAKSPIKATGEPSDWAAYVSGDAHDATTQPAIDQSLLGHTYTVVMPMRVSVADGGTVTNTCERILNAFHDKSNKVSTPVFPLDPTKDVVINVTDGASSDGSSIEKDSVILYRLDSSKLTANRAYPDIDSWTYTDKLDTKHDAYTGRWAVYAAQDIDYGDGVTVAKGERIAGDGFDSSKFGGDLFEATYSNDGTLVISATALGCKLMSADVAESYSAFVQVRRIATGDVDNTWNEGLKGKERTSNKVTTHTPEHHPSVSVEKFDTASGADKGDRDTADQALDMDSDSTKLTFVVTNTGDTALDGISLTDQTVDGTGTLADVDWNGVDIDKLVLEPGQSMTVTGTLRGVRKGSTHTDESTVTATALVDCPVVDDDPWDDTPAVQAGRTCHGTSVTDSDRWNGKRAASKPSISVEKYDLASGKADGDRDTADQALDMTGPTAGIGIDVTNTGDTDVTALSLDDKTIAGTGTLIGIDYPDNWDTLVLHPGQTITVTGTVAGVRAGDIHTDEVTATGTEVAECLAQWAGDGIPDTYIGGDSSRGCVGKQVTSTDDWNGKREATNPSVDVEKFDDADGDGRADASDGSVDMTQGDRDTADDAKALDGADAVVYVRVKNTGDTNLVNPTVTDRTVSGTGTVDWTQWSSDDYVSVPEGFDRTTAPMSHAASTDASADKADADKATDKDKADADKATDDATDKSTDKADDKSTDKVPDPVVIDETAAVDGQAVDGLTFPMTLAPGEAFTIALHVTGVAQGSTHEDEATAIAYEEGECIAGVAGDGIPDIMLGDSCIAQKRDDKGIVIGGDGNPVPSTVTDSDDWNAQRPAEPVDPTKDVTIDVGGQSKNGATIPYGSTFLYRIDSSTLDALDSRAPITGWGGTDTLPKEDTYTGEWAVYATRDITVKGTTVAKAGDQIAGSGFTPSDALKAALKDAGGDDAMFTLAADGGTLTVSATKSALAMYTEQSGEIGWRLYVKATRTGTGDVDNTWTEDINGTTMDSNTVTTHTPKSTAGVSVEKYDVASGPSAGDRDSAADALQMTGDTRIAVTVTNTSVVEGTGSDDVAAATLSGVSLADALVSGVGATNGFVTSDGQDATQMLSDLTLAPGQGVTVYTTVSGVGAGQSHTDRVTVTADPKAPCAPQAGAFTGLDPSLTGSADQTVAHTASDAVAMCSTGAKVTAQDDWNGVMPTSPSSALAKTGIAIATALAVIIALVGSGLALVAARRRGKDDASGK